MENSFKFVFIAIFIAFTNGQELENIEFINDETISITYQKSEQPFQVYMVKTNTLKGYWPGLFDEQNMTEYVIISIPNSDDMKVEILPQIFLHEKTKIIPVNACERNVVIDRIAKGCPIVKAEQHEMLKITNFTLYFYNMKINVECGKFTLIKTCKQCVVELLPKCKVQANGLNYVAPDKLPVNSFPTLIPITTAIKSEKKVSNKIAYLLVLFFGMILILGIFIYLKYYGYFKKKDKAWVKKDKVCKNDMEISFE